MATGAISIGLLACVTSHAFAIGCGTGRPGYELGNDRYLRNPSLLSSFLKPLGAWGPGRGDRGHTRNYEAQRKGVPGIPVTLSNYGKLP